MRQAAGGNFADGDKLAGAVFVFAVPLVGDGDDAAVGQDVLVGEVVGVDVAVEPAEDLGLGLGVKVVAVEAQTVGIVDVIVAVAGYHVLGPALELQGLAERAGSDVDKLYAIAVVAVGEDADVAVTQLDEVFGVVVEINVEVDGAVGVEDADEHVAGDNDLAVVGDDHVVRVEGVVAVGAAAELGTAQLSAGSVETAEIEVLLVLVVVIVFVAVFLNAFGSVAPREVQSLKRHQAAVSHEAELGKVAGRGLTVTLKLNGGVVFKLGAGSVIAVEVQTVLVYVVLTLVLGGSVVLHLADLLVLNGVEAGFGEQEGVEVGMSVAVIQLGEAGRVDIFRRRRAVGLAVAAVITVVAVLAAGAERERHCSDEQKRDKLCCLFHYVPPRK